MTGSRYLGGFICKMDAQMEWLRMKLKGWADAARMLEGVTHCHLKVSYSGMQSSLQQEWNFMQCVTPDVGPLFGRVEIALREAFFPTIFQDSEENMIGHEMTQIPFSRVIFALPDMILSTP